MNTSVQGLKFDELGHIGLVVVHALWVISLGLTPAWVVNHLGVAEHVVFDCLEDGQWILLDQASHLVLARTCVASILLFKG